MTLARSAAVTDRGRKRRRNEDAYVCQPPLFAVADGMGGAQAGEIASRLAAAVIREDATTGTRAEDRVNALIQQANRRVYERSSEDEAASGMGTTITVALVHDGQVTIGHVGDSRAYLIRGGRLEQLTDDHSLVAELVRSGKLSPEEAESHPQRSVITRVLGTDPDVDIDTFTVAVEPHDLFLICSDGLTSMVDDEKILAIAEETRGDLDATAKALVQEANRGGGEDNITLVFFEISGEVEQVEETGEIGRDGRPDEDQDTLSELEAIPPVSDIGETGSDEVSDTARRRRLGRRGATTLAVAAVVLAIAAAGALFAISRAHFVGAEKDGHVAVYQGIPWNVVGGLRLYRAVYVSPSLVAAQLSQGERRLLFDHDLTSKDTALRKVKRYEREITP